MRPLENYLDCRGKLCPVPLLETRRALETMEAGALIVLVDQLAAKENITRAMVDAGHEVLAEECNGEWMLTVTKGAAAPQPAAEPSGAGASAGPTVVLITDRGVGRTDADLGRILMKSFLATLTQAPVPPATILLLQGGVELVCDGADSVKPLRELEERGVTILACGTCLDYFGLMDKVRVGKITNMAEILERLSTAGRVIPV